MIRTIHSLENIDEFVDKVPQAIACSLVRLSQRGFEFGKSLLDWTGIIAPSRQKPQYGGPPLQPTCALKRAWNSTGCPC